MDVTTMETERRAEDGRAPASVDALLGLSADALARLYRAAEVPRLAALSGDLRGRMLAWPKVRGRAAELLRALAASDAFPWRGKSFRPHGEDAGEGVNRIFSDRLRRFRFTTSVGRSRAGAFDAVQLDYDHPENPSFIRAIKDELRQLRPGLYLGQAYLHARGADRLVLYFGLEG